MSLTAEQYKALLDQQQQAIQQQKDALRKLQLQGRLSQLFYDLNLGSQSKVRVPYSAFAEQIGRSGDFFKADIAGEREIVVNRRIDDLAEPAGYQYWTDRDGDDADFWLEGELRTLTQNCEWKDDKCTLKLQTYWISPQWYFPGHEPKVEEKTEEKTEKTEEEKTEVVQEKTEVVQEKTEVVQEKTETAEPVTISVEPTQTTATTEVPASAPQ